MDPYLWTWLARYGAACALAGLWLVTAAHQAVRRRWATSGAFGALALTTGAALATYLAPLLQGDPIPSDPWALELAAGAPFVAFAALAAFGRPLPGRFDLWTLAPVALVSHGVPAWVLSLVLVGRGWLLAGPVRGLLLTGVVLLGVATAVDGGRQALRETAQDQGFTSDQAVHLVSAVSSGLECAGWAAMTRWAILGRAQGVAWTFTVSPMSARISRSAS